MLGDLKQICFIASIKDNVATALCNIEPGKLRLTGETEVEDFCVCHQIQYGHKLALQNIKYGNPIIKYGSVIGKAKKDIKKGEWVHIHNCGSLYEKWLMKGKSDMIGLEHIGICANDTVKLKDWYVRLLKFHEVLFIDSERPTFFLAMPDNMMLEIYPAESQTTPHTNRTQGLRHLAFVTDDIDKEYKQLKENDVEIIEEISMMKQGKVRTVFFKDAEGNILHFVQREKNLIQA